MKYLPLIAAALSLSFASAAFANPDGDKPKFQPDVTRADAIKRTEKRLDELKAMSDDQWNKKREERKKRWEERRAKRAAKGERPAAAAKAEPAAKPAQ